MWRRTKRHSRSADLSPSGARWEGTLWSTSRQPPRLAARPHLLYCTGSLGFNDSVRIRRWKTVEIIRRLSILYLPHARPLPHVVACWKYQRAALVTRNQTFDGVPAPSSLTGTVEYGSQGGDGIWFEVADQRYRHVFRGQRPACCRCVHVLSEEYRIMDQREHQFIGHADGSHCEGNYAGERASA